MTSISGFKYDIFISYAHLDNQTVAEEEEGWIEWFRKHLELSLNRRYGIAGAIKVWWDEKRLDGSMLFNQSIQKGIQESAIMLCLSSHAYLKSNYCNKEKELFFEKAQKESQGLELDDRYRIINVQLNQFPIEEWPEEYKGRTGFSFNDAEDKNEHGEPLDPNGPEFKKQLRLLTEAVFELITSFSSGNKIPDSLPDEKESIDVMNTIYFGEVSDSLRSIKKRAIIELEKKGLTVITNVPPPHEPKDHESVVKNHLEKVALSVHLFDQFAGREIIDDTDSFYGQKQAELALKYGKNQLIWVPKELEPEEIEEEGYKNFINDFESGDQEGPNYEYIRGMPSSLTREVVDFMGVVQSRKTSDYTPEQSTVLLDTHFNDQLYALELSKYLLEHQVQPFVNPQEDDPRKNLNLLAERISQVRTLVFFYGKVSKEWVIERINATMQLIINNNLPVEDLFILLLPDKKDPNEITFKQRFLKMDVLDNSDSTRIKQDNLNHLITRIKGGMA